MAVIIGRQKMTVRHAGGEHTIFPSADPQILPDHLLDHPHVKGAIASEWIKVKPSPEPAPESLDAESPAPEAKRVKRNATQKG